MSTRKHRAGFTLIELLVVIAIIAILAAILFPVFAKAREKAMQTTCLNNIKEQALAVHMYLGDNDGFFPVVLSDRNWVLREPGGSAGDPWFMCQPPPCLRTGLMPYVENNYALFHCPLDNATHLDHWENGSGPRTSHALSYVYPCYASASDTGVFGAVICDQAGNITNPNYLKAKNIDDMGAPANTVIIREMGTGFYDYARDTVEYDDECTGTPAFRESAFVHGENANFAFGDGHAKAIDIDLKWNHCTILNAQGPDYCQAVADMYTFKLSGATH